jgi:hypothetical protein
MTGSVRARVDAIVIGVTVACVAVLLFVLMPDRQPIAHRYRCANGATAVTWHAVDGDGQTVTNVRCTP